MAAVEWLTHELIGSTNAQTELLFKSLKLLIKCGGYTKVGRIKGILQILCHTMPH